jgi:hypothetical protein
MKTELSVTSPSLEAGENQQTPYNIGYLSLLYCHLLELWLTILPFQPLEKENLPNFKLPTW